MALDAGPGVEAVASQPMWLHWVSESGKVRRHAPDFFVRRADGTGVLIDVRPDHLVRAADSAVFAATAVMAGQAGWAYDRLGELPAVRAANLRWLAGYRHRRYARTAVMATLAEVFAEPGLLRDGAAQVGDPELPPPVRRRGRPARYLSRVGLDGDDALVGTEAAGDPASRCGGRWPGRAGARGSPSRRARASNHG